MIFGLCYKDKRKPYIWFAWRPVHLMEDGRWVWLQKVIKERWPNLRGCDYSLMETKNEK